MKRARKKRRLFENCIGGPRLPESKRRTARLRRASTLPQLVCCGPVASAARLVPAALRGAGTSDFNGERLPGGIPGAAFGPFLAGRNHDP